MYGKITYITLLSLVLWGIVVERWVKFDFLLFPIVFVLVHNIYIFTFKIIFQVVKAIKLSKMTKKF